MQSGDERRDVGITNLGWSSLLIPFQIIYLWSILRFIRSNLIWAALSFLCYGATSAMKRSRGTFIHRFSLHFGHALPIILLLKCTSNTLLNSLLIILQMHHFFKKPSFSMQLSTVDTSRNWTKNSKASRWRNKKSITGSLTTSALQLPTQAP